MQTQTKSAPTAQPAPLNVAPLPPAVKIPSHSPSAQTPPSPAPETKPAPMIEMHEAPYSCNCTAIGAEGFSEMFTVRAISPEGFYARVAQLKSNLLDLGYKPSPVRGASASTPAAGTDEQAPVCGIHGKPMQKRQGHNGSFWSCPEKFANGAYCNYKPK